MRSRGRPPHPDILTPREWDVFHLLRQGRSNSEIADLLGMTLDGAKYHVSSILSKLGVSSRIEASRWQPIEKSSSRWALAMLISKFAGAAVASAAIAGVAIIGYGTVHLGSHPEGSVLAEDTALRNGQTETAVAVGHDESDPESAPASELPPALLRASSDPPSSGGGQQEPEGLPIGSPGHSSAPGDAATPKPGRGGIATPRPRSTPSACRSCDDDETPVPTPRATPVPPCDSCTPSPSHTLIPSQPTVTATPRPSGVPLLGEAPQPTPTATPEPPTPSPIDEDDGGEHEDDDHGSGQEVPEPAETPEPHETPELDETPEAGETPEAHEDAETPEPCEECHP